MRGYCTKADDEEGVRDEQNSWHGGMEGLAWLGADPDLAYDD